MLAFQDLVQDVLANGKLYSNGKGKCLGVIGAQVKYDISNTIPVVTAKKTNFRWAMVEMAMFIKGISHIDFLKPYGAEKLWEGQALSEDHIVETIRPPLEVIKEFSEKTNTSVDEATKFMNERAQQYSDAKVALIGRLAPAEELGVEITEGEYLSQDEYKTKIQELETWLAEPFVELGIEIRIPKTVRTKGDLGPIYGSQWRSWTGIAPNGKTVRIDQIKDIIGKLRRASTTRQAILTSWYPLNIVDESYSYDDKIKAGLMGQPPCHVNYHFLVRENEEGELALNTTVWLRSNDLMLGHPFNAIGATVLTHLMANELGFKVGQLTMQISDAHLYEEHIEGAKEYCERPVHDVPTFNLPKEVTVFNFEVEDLLNAVGEYTHEPYMPFPLKTRVKKEEITK